MSRLKDYIEEMESIDIFTMLSKLFVHACLVLEFTKQGLDVSCMGMKEFKERLEQLMLADCGKWLPKGIGPEDVLPEKESIIKSFRRGELEILQKNLVEAILECKVCHGLEYASYADIEDNEWFRSILRVCQVLAWHFGMNGGGDFAVIIKEESLDVGVHSAMELLEACCAGTAREAAKEWEKYEAPLWNMEDW